MSTAPTKHPRPSRVLGTRAFAAITAVEGLELSPSSRARLKRMAAEGLPRDERREAVMRAWRSTRPRG